MGHNEAQFTTVAYDTSSPYIDGRAPLAAGQAEMREYLARYVNCNHLPIGDRSDVVSAVAKP